MSATNAPQRGQSIVEFTLVLPVMLILLLGIVDLARIYTTMMSVESAAREAADYGTTLGAGQVAGRRAARTRPWPRWSAGRASPPATSPDYARSGRRSATGGCTNPSFAYCVTAVDRRALCEPSTRRPAARTRLRAPPCTVTVTLAYDFHLLAPLNFDFFGVRFGFPSTITFERDSTLRDDRHRPGADAAP